MSIQSFAPLGRPGAGLVSGALNRVADQLRSLGHEWQARRAARQVEALDDDTLHDIGIARGNIDRAVRCGRSGR